MMKTAVSAKRCPECGKAALLEAPACPACGHRYRTRFAAPPVERTQAFDIMLVPPVVERPPRVSPAVRTFVLSFASSFGLVALVGGLLWLGWGLRAAPVKPRPAAAQPLTKAERLYGAIGPGMSLYDVEQAAGGAGRVIRSRDPYMLLLFYDLAHQSVLVSLNRSDVSSGDYRVRSVALYQGKTLLRHRAEQE